MSLNRREFVVSLFSILPAARVASRYIGKPRYKKAGKLFLFDPSSLSFTCDYGITFAVQSTLPYPLRFKKLEGESSIIVPAFLNV